MKMRCIDFEAFESEFGQHSGAVDFQVSRLQSDVSASCRSSILDSNLSYCFRSGVSEIIGTNCPLAQFEQISLCVRFAVAFAKIFEP